MHAAKESDKLLKWFEKGEILEDWEKQPEDLVKRMVAAPKNDNIDSAVCITHKGNTCDAVCCLRSWAHNEL